MRKQALFILLSVSLFIFSCSLFNTPDNSPPSQPISPKIQPSDDSSPQQLYNQAEEEFNSGNFDKALGLIVEIRKKNDIPKVKEAELKIYETMWKYINEDFSSKLYERALEKIEVLEKYLNNDKLKLSKGIIYFHKGNIDNADKILSSISTDFSKDSSFLTIKGFIAFEKGDIKGAISSWQKANTETANLGLSVIDFNNKGKSWSDNFQKYKDAISDLPENLQKASNFGKLLADMHNSMPITIEVQDISYKNSDKQKDNIVGGDSFYISFRVINKNPYRALKDAICKIGNTEPQKISVNENNSIKVDSYEIIAANKDKKEENGNSFIPINVSIESSQLQTTYNENIKIPLKNSDDNNENNNINIIHGGIPIPNKSIDTDKASIKINIQINDKDGFDPDNVPLDYSCDETSNSYIPKLVYAKKKIENNTFLDILIPVCKEGENIYIVRYTNKNNRTIEKKFTINKTKPNYNKYAVLVGIKDYQGKLEINPQFIEKDLKLMETVLLKHDYQVEKVTNATQSDIDKILRLFKDSNSIKIKYDTNVVKENDDVIFYFCGHGFLKKNTIDTKGYFVPYGGDPDNAHTCNEMKKIADDIKNGPGRHKILILDSCHAGLALQSKEGDDLPNTCDPHYVNNPATYYFLSSDSGENSWIDMNLGKSEFTRILAEALDGKASDINGCINMDAISLYVKGKIKIQHPIFRQIEGTGAPEFINPNRN
ncbi:MAG: caspase family protein [Desulfobacterales bacterium]|nr:caspase family protein [Desulfobacterales bacterium]